MGVTIKEVARKAGVTTATVSRSLSKPELVRPETRQKVMDAVKRLGYRPHAAARHLRLRSARTVGIFVPHETRVFGEQYTMHILSGIESVLCARGYRLLFYPPELPLEGGVAFSPFIGDGSADGLLVICPWVRDETVQQLKSSKTPFVLVNGEVEGLKTPYVGLDNVDAARTAVEHLIRLGHRRIACLNGLMKINDARERFEGYQQALAKHGLPLRPEWVKEGDYQREKAAEAARAWLKLPQPPSAIFCANDMMAFSVLQVLEEQGISVPKEISVVGMDDFEVAGFRFAALSRPPLTSMKLPFEEMGRRAAQRLLGKLAGHDEKEKTLLLKANLVVRGSTGKGIGE